MSGNRDISTISGPSGPFTYGLPSTSPTLPPASLAREINTGNGRTFAYELGPEHGRKLLFLCGGGTPAPILYPLADRLSKRGNRVLLFDYYGRGYSDCPTKVHHDKALFISQILDVLKSSPLAWTGTESTGFSIVGYSIGGAIAMAFAAASHPVHIAIDEIILLAAAGLLKDCLTFMEGVREPDTYNEDQIKAIIKPVLGFEVETDDVIAKNQERNTTEANTEKAELTQILRWQYQNHLGYPFGQLSMLLHGPIEGQHEDWRTVATKDDLKPKILAVFATDDPVVKEAEVRPEIDKIIVDRSSETSRKGNSDSAVQARFTFSTIQGDHEFPYTKVDRVVDTITEWFER